VLVQVYSKTPKVVAILEEMVQTSSMDYSCGVSGNDFMEILERITKKVDAFDQH
jgi:hypothetical protein